METIRFAVHLFYLYLLAGVVFAAFFLWRGIDKIDAMAQGLSWKTRALFFPGAAAFWPLLWRKWRRGEAEVPPRPNPRTAHPYWWLALAVLLPAGWLAAIWVIPGPVWQDPAGPAQAEALPVLVRSGQSGPLLFRLRQDGQGVRGQVEVVLTEPLDAANATLVVEGPPERALGLLGSRGVWRFALDSLPAEGRPLKLRVDDRLLGRTRYRVRL